MTWRFVDISGTAIDIADYNLKIMRANGVGMPEPVLLTTQFANADGVHYDGQYTPDRQFSLTMISRTSDPDSYFTARKNLKALVRRHRQPEDLPFALQYIAEGTASGTIQLECRYRDGLGLDEPRGYKEAIALFLMAEQPYWSATEEGTITLNAPGTTTFNNIARKTGKANWDDIGGGFGTVVYTLDYNGVGDLIAGGQYTTHGTAAGTVRRVARLQAGSAAWEEIDGGVNDFVLKAKYKPGTNQAWFGGAFGTVDVGGGGTAANAIAYYDFDTTTWATLTEGGTAGIPSAWVRDFDWDAEGNVLIGGTIALNNFQNAVAYDVAGGTFTYISEDKTGVIGTAVWGFDNQIGAVRRIDSDEYSQGTARTYLAGAGTAWLDSAGSPSTASYTSPYIWRDYGHSFTTGFENNAGGGCFIRTIEVDNNNNVWFGGNMDNEHINGEPTGIKDLYRVAVYDGARFINMDVGLTDEIVYGLEYSSYRKGMFAVGDYTEAGGDKSIQHAGFHNGSVWVKEQLDFSGVTVRAVAAYEDEVVFGFDGTITANISETTINNVGTAPTPCIFEFTGPGVLQYVYNQTTDHIVQFNGLTLFSNETLTIDMVNGKTVTSNVRGNMARYLVEPGDIEDFHLAGGDNIIKSNHDTTLALSIVRFTPLYESIDDIYG